MADFFQMIRPVRMMKGIKQSEIADHLEIRQQSVSKLENGKTRVSMAAADKIAQCLGFNSRMEMEKFYDRYLRHRIKIEDAKERK